MLRRWRESDLPAFSDMNADPAVMKYFPAPLTHDESADLMARIETCFRDRGCGLWAAEIQSDGQLAGFVGLAPVEAPYPFAPAVEVGWRLARSCWGQGFATDGANASLRFGFDTIGLTEIVSFTSAINLPSRRVMERIGMTRNPCDDFDHPLVSEGDPLRRHVLYRIKCEAVTVDGQLGAGCNLHPMPIPSWDEPADRSTTTRRPRRVH